MKDKKEPLVCPECGLHHSRSDGGKYRLLKCQTKARLAKDSTRLENMLQYCAEWRKGREVD
jgi:hypothetical protein